MVALILSPRRSLLTWGYERPTSCAGAHSKQPPCTPMAESCAKCEAGPCGINSAGRSDPGVEAMARSVVASLRPAWEPHERHSLTARSAAVAGERRAPWDDTAREAEPLPNSGDDMAVGADQFRGREPHAVTTRPQCRFGGGPQPRAGPFGVMAA